MKAHIFQGVLDAEPVVEDNYFHCLEEEYKMIGVEVEETGLEVVLIRVDGHIDWAFDAGDNMEVLVVGEPNIAE
jgi:hypothetical protein